MTPREAKRYLDSFANFELSNTSYAPSFRLDRVHHLLELLGNPQKKIKIIHVAGTKGKGSTCAFTAFILKNAGYKVGLYTSPHLNDYKERIRILNPRIKYGALKDSFAGKIKMSAFCRLLGKIKPVVETLRNDKEFGGITYFEIYTVLALCYFKENKVDFAVLETGLGGRLDATNTADSLVCAITPISLEHTQQLGKTLTKIAAEKAAIIKSRHQTVIVAPQINEALKVIKKYCRKLYAQPVFVGKDIVGKSIRQNLKEQTFEVKTSKKTYAHLKTKLLGRHQVVNAAVSIGIVEALEEKGFKISEQAVREGIKETIWPGRFEMVRSKPLVILDGAHNSGSSKVLAQTIKDLFPKEKVTIILGISKDKDRKGICRELRKIARQFILTKARHPRALDFKTVRKENLFAGVEVKYTGNIKGAMNLALRQKEEIIIVTGSLFIVAEARKLCN